MPRQEHASPGACETFGETFGDPGIQGDVSGMCGDLLPVGLDHGSQHGVTEQTVPILDADGDKVGTGLGVVVSAHADGTPA